MNNEIAVTNKDGQTLEEVLIQGDLSGLTPEQCVVYYEKVCDSVGINKLTRPFEYMTFQGKKILYARKDCAEQLRKIHKISIYDTQVSQVGSLYIVKVSASTPDGRQDSAIGALNIDNMKGEQLGNAMMKCETKAKRRVTLSICGLGILDESDIEDANRTDFQKFEDTKITVKDAIESDPTQKAIETAHREGLFVYKVPNATRETELWFEKRSAFNGPAKGVFFSKVDLGPKAEQHLDKPKAVTPEVVEEDDDIPMGETSQAPAVTNVQKAQERVSKMRAA